MINSYIEINSIKICLNIGDLMVKRICVFYPATRDATFYCIYSNF